VGGAEVRTTPPPPHEASNTAMESAPSQPVTLPANRIQCSLLMETAMSDLFDEYPLLMLVPELLVALFVLVFIVVYMSSGKKKANRDKQR
jgi:hypothetical protein